MTHSLPSRRLAFWRSEKRVLAVALLGGACGGIVDLSGAARVSAVPSSAFQTPPQLDRLAAVRLGVISLDAALHRKRPQ